MDLFISISLHPIHLSCRLLKPLSAGFLFYFTVVPSDGLIKNDAALVTPMKLIGTISDEVFVWNNILTNSLYVIYS